MRLTTSEDQEQQFFVDLNQPICLKENTARLFVLGQHLLHFR